MVYTLGESLLDVIVTNLDNVVAKPGGSMLNVAVSLGRMNIPVIHISEMGSNPAAEMMLKFLNKNGVNTKYVVRYQGENTSVALAFLDDNKKPSYQFISAYPKSRKLDFPPTFQPDDILLFGSLYSISTPIRSFILKCIQQAKKAGSLVIYDPNIRHKHHLEEKNVREAMMENLRLAHIIKASDEDCANLFGENSPDVYLDKLSQINS
ncbi:MAG: PfkB family carbohydrate kinase, partial [Bacteroidales bacterium]